MKVKVIMSLLEKIGVEAGDYIGYVDKIAGVDAHTQKLNVEKNLRKGRKKKGQ